MHQQKFFQEKPKGTGASKFSILATKTSLNVKNEWTEYATACSSLPKAVLIVKFYRHNLSQKNVKQPHWQTAIEKTATLEGRKSANLAGGDDVSLASCVEV